jgi:hypothetical protein
VNESTTPVHRRDGQPPQSGQQVPPVQPPGRQVPPAQPSGQQSPPQYGWQTPPPFGQQAPPAPSVQQAPQQYAPQQYGQQHYGLQAPTQQYPQPGAPASGYPQPGPQPGYPQPGYAQPAPVQPYAVPTAEKPAKLSKPASRRATTGLVLGVIGVIGGIFFGWTLLFSIVAIVLGVLARSREPHARGIALGAIVTGVVGVLLSIGWLAYSILTWLALTAS